MAMKSETELRMECLRLATVCASAKIIKGSEVLPYAMEFFRWVDNDPNDKVDTKKLASTFKVVG